MVDVPLDSLGAQLLFTLGVSLILFYGGLNLSLPVLRKVWMSLGMLAVPGVVLTTLMVGVTAAYLVFDLPWDWPLSSMGAVLSPTDPAILIPLFVRSRLKRQAGADGDRRVRLQRPDRRGAGAHARRRAAQRGATRSPTRRASSSWTSGSAR